MTTASINMAIYRHHIPYLLDILGISDLSRDPVLIFGFHDCIYLPRKTLIQFIKHHIKLGLQLLLKRKFRGLKRRSIGKIPEKYMATSFQEILERYEMHDVKILDWFDHRADIQLDMNHPIPSDLKERFNTLFDFGSIEHVFDTKQCMMNLFDLLKLDGHLILHTPCNGYFDHGFHTFSPECLLQTLDLNGFEIKYLKYTSPDGLELGNPDSVCDTLIWIVAKKVQETECFKIPQQGRWKEKYDNL